MRKNWPMIQTVLVALTSLLLVILVQEFYFWMPFVCSSSAMVWFAGGFVYVHFFEYSHHRGPMHTLIEIPATGLALTDKVSRPINKIFRAIRKSHRKHHAIFHGRNFQSNKSEELKHVTAPPLFFPSAFAVHYFVLLLFLVPNSLTFFAIGVVVRYLIYELLHFLTHNKDNRIDKFLLRLPMVGNLRKVQIEYHQEHHNFVKGNFSVTPPYIDGLFGTKIETLYIE